jgi:hypothetical protein
MSKYLNLSPQLNTEEKAKIFEEIVEKLKYLDLDGDTTEVLLNEVGTIDLMFDFLIGQERYLTARKVWDDIFDNQTLIYNNFDDYFNDEFLKEM